MVLGVHVCALLQWRLDRLCMTLLITVQRMVDYASKRPIARGRYWPAIGGWTLLRDLSIHN